MKIILNSIRCNICLDTIVSRHRHDFKFCECGNIAVDGGDEYLRRVGHGISTNSYTDLSIEVEEKEIGTKDSSDGDQLS